MAMAGTRIVLARSLTVMAHPSGSASIVSAVRSQQVPSLCSSSSCSTSLVSCRSSSSAKVSRRFASPSRKWSCSRRSVHSSVVFCTSTPSSTVVETSDPTTAPAAPKESPPVTQVELDALDIRVGKVIKAWKHPEADSLYVEEVDLAEAEGPRTICSGLVKFLTLENLEGRDVVVLANLKPRNMRGVKSNGMLLAASNAEHTTVQLLSPPEGSVPGERIWFGSESEQSEQAAAVTPNQLAKKKFWESVQPLLRTTEECVAECQSKPMRTSTGVVRCQSLQGANIS